MKCKRCDFEEPGTPNFCRACLAMNWGSENGNRRAQRFIPNCTCRQCGHVWRSRVNEPLRCPVCKTLMNVATRAERIAAFRKTLPPEPTPESFLIVDAPEAPPPPKDDEPYIL